MTTATNYTVNKFLVDNILRGQSNAIPTTLYYALAVASKGYAATSTAYSSGDTVIPATPNGHIYKCTVAGTSGGSAPVWPTGAGSTVADGGVTWTEQTTAMLAGTFTEATYTGYARVSQASSLANWAGTQAAASTTASTGTSGQTSNNNQITFGAPTSTQAGVVAAMFLADASSAGNILFWSILTNPQSISNGAAAPYFPAASMTVTWS